MAKTDVKENQDAGAEVAKKDGQAEPTPAPASGPTPAPAPGPTPAPGSAPVPAPRRAPGQKEVIPFEWKVCGYAADGHTLTLFKSIELADSEGQLARLISEGYYDGLKLYGVDDRVPESAKAKKLRLARKKKGKKSGGAVTDKTTESTKPARKAAKAPNVVTTAMGKMVDGRITVGRKKSAGPRTPDKGAATKAGAKRSAKARSGAATKKKVRATAKSSKKQPAKKKSTTAAKKKKKAPARKKAKPKVASKKSARKPASKSGKKTAVKKKQKTSSSKRRSASGKR